MLVVLACRCSDIISQNRDLSCTNIVLYCTSIHKLQHNVQHVFRLEHRFQLYDIRMVTALQYFRLQERQLNGTQSRTTQVPHDIKVRVVVGVKVRVEVEVRALKLVLKSELKLKR